jgi:hypothetical protein
MFYALFIANLDCKITFIIFSLFLSMYMYVVRYYYYYYYYLILFFRYIIVREIDIQYINTKIIVELYICVPNYNKRENFFLRYTHIATHPTTNFGCGRISCLCSLTNYYFLLLLQYSYYYYFDLILYQKVK